MRAKISEILIFSFFFDFLSILSMFSKKMKKYVFFFFFQKNIFFDDTFFDLAQNL